MSLTWELKHDYLAQVLYALRWLRSAIRLVR